MDLSKVKISTKIRISFIMLALIAVALIAISIFQSLKLNNNYKNNITIINAKIVETADATIYCQNINIAVRELLMNTEDSQKFESIATTIKENQAYVGEIAQRYAALLTGDYELQAFAANGENIGKYFGMLADIEDGLRTGRITAAEAKTIIDEQGAHLEKSIVDAMALANQTATNELNSVMVNNTTSVTQTIRLLIFITVVVLILTIIASVIVSNSINNPIKKLVEAAKKISKGNLDLNLRSNHKDEMSILSNEIAEVVDTLNTLINEVYTMSEDIQNKGDVERRINEKLFKGDYLKLGSGINTVIDGLTGDTLGLIACLKEYSEGNFDAQVKRYVGKKATLNDAVDTLQNNLKSIVSDINELAHYASNGNLTKRIDENKYKNDWANLTIGLNSVLVNIVNPVRETISTLESMSQGNLSVHIEGDYKGEYLTMKTAVNKTLDNLSSYVNDISGILNKMSKGEFDIKIETKYIGDFSSIGVSLANILNTFNELLENINLTAEDVAKKSDMILKSSITLSSGTDKQLTATNYLLSNVTTITEQTQQNAINSNNANSLALEAKQVASLGKEEMQDMLEAMGTINQASNNISKIIKVIEDISFQTNLLALNAAVEAARAGVHGKGFAVVSEEVRSLAHRSRSAVADTATLIEASLSKVADGMKIAEQTSDTLIQIVAQVSNISDIIDNIAKSSVTQKTAIKELNDGINTISEITSDNVSFVETETIFAKQLNESSDKLKILVSAFKFKHLD